MGEEKKVIVYVEIDTVEPLMELLNFVKVNGRRNNKNMIIRAINIEQNFKIIEKDEFNSILSNSEVFKLGKK